MELYTRKQLAGVRIKHATDAVAVSTEETDLFPGNGGNIPGKTIEPMVCRAARIANPYSLSKK
jgi:hypothetical protein